MKSCTPKEIRNDGDGNKRMDINCTGQTNKWKRWKKY